ncbi:phosphoribosylformylglycinamidine synthase subunit PurQ [Paenibacillus yanchengensis]|uniref:Phosphoribosylformylglycinamidine synthase subunit PurQ n=1 Tax=Paenibacillus yanchengensis TaxID=2035833 RepID=A0ABW4YFE0_9BACL
MKFAVLVFPGSNGDIDSYRAVKTIGEQVEYVWHETTDLSDYDVIILPGGATYGNYVRPGALASHAAIIDGLKQAVEQGKLVIGISNGFQILTEAGLLPGTFMPNEGLKFSCKYTSLVVENNATAFTGDYKAAEQISLPIAHAEGNYYCDSATLATMQANGQIVLRYAADYNPDGSLDNIAGIVNETGNVFGLMPHPERAMDELFGSEDGKRIFTSILKAWREKNGTTVNS